MTNTFACVKQWIIDLFHPGRQKEMRATIDRLRGEVNSMTHRMDMLLNLNQQYELMVKGQLSRATDIIAKTATARTRPVRLYEHTGIEMGGVDSIDIDVDQFVLQLTVDVPNVKKFSNFKVTDDRLRWEIFRELRERAACALSEKIRSVLFEGVWK